MYRQKNRDNGVIRIDIDRSRITSFCRRHHICSLALFGSVLREEFTPTSDVDVLIQFDDGYTPGWEFFDLEDALSAILGERVNLNTPGFLSRSFRRRVIDEALVV